jgi:hypothetical protein
MSSVVLRMNSSPFSMRWYVDRSSPIAESSAFTVDQPMLAAIVTDTTTVRAVAVLLLLLRVIVGS